VAGAETLTLGARVIAASHRDLAACVAAGRFREDLDYRLDVLRVAVPPLRERLEDLDALVDAAVARSGADGRIRFDAAALARLRLHPWPGNVRELENVVERCVARVPSGVIGRDVIDRALAWSPISVRREPRGGAGPARRLGLARSTLRYRIQRLGLAHLLPREPSTTSRSAEGASAPAASNRLRAESRIGSR